MAELKAAGNMEIRALRTPDSVSRAVAAIGKGAPVVTQLMNNFGYLADPANTEAVAHILHSKHDDNTKKPFSAMLPTEVFCSAIDLTHVPGELHELLSNPMQLEERLGLMCHLRAPITQEAAAQLPDRIVSWDPTHTIPFVQNFFIKGNSDLEAIRDGLYAEGKLLSVTTLNQHGTPEITTLPEAIEEAKQATVELLLTDEPKRPEIKGSWAIINVTDLTAARDGCIPISIIARLLKVPIDTAQTVKSNHVQDEAFLLFLKELEAKEIEPKDMRMLVLAYLGGMDITSVLQLLTQT
jgi:tRNA A37 threonylcarbamoyladenosine synthetase subunit TsaC/SUA5/YrdC